jgi:hypothetical protein
MNRAVPLTLLLCMALPAAAPMATAANLNYQLYVLGVAVGEAAFSLDLSAPAYRMSMRFQTTGIADVFVGDRVEEHTSGRFDHDQPAPLEYGSNGRRHGEDRVVNMIWRDGSPVVTAIAPPNSSEREDVPAALLPHTVDPLDAIVFLLRQVARTGRCEGSSRAYDGRRLELLQAITSGWEEIPPSSRSSFSGRALRCDFVDKTLGGFRLGSGRDDDARDHHGTIWLAQVIAGQAALPVRAAIETRWFGEATIYVTSATP